MSHPRPSDPRNRYAWVDFAKGFCIVAVVGMWIAATMQGHVAKGQAGWLGYFVVFAKPFRMPDFFLISGLFLSQVIDRPWKHYLDTKVVHYLYFFVLWTVIVLPVTWLLGQETPANAGDAGSALLYHLYDPFGMLWFIMMLSVYFVATRLLRQVPVWIMLPAAVLMFVFPLHTGIYHVDRFGMFFLFFYVGHVFSGQFFVLADWTREHRRPAIAGLLVWAVVNAVLVKLALTEYLAVNLLAGFMGISAVVVIASLVSSHPWAGWLNTLGKNSIAIYLGFYLPMIIIVPALQASPIGRSPSLVATLSMVSVIGIAMGAFHLANRIGLAFLYNRPDWIRLVQPRQRAASAVSATAGGRAISPVTVSKPTSSI
jgi:uncharacterized membrane protein YcfT